MAITRRSFIRGGVAAFTVSFAAPGFLCELARAQGARSRNLVVLYLAGGNDSLNTVVPYLDPFYYSRRPTIAVPAGQVLQIGTDSARRALGLHPRLGGLLQIFNQGHLAVMQRVGYANSSRSHFQGADIWGTADPNQPSAMGWLGKYLETVPFDPLVAWTATQDLPRALLSKTVAVPAIPDARAYSFNSPNAGVEAQYERRAATRMAGYSPGAGESQLAFVSGTARAALDTLDRVASFATYPGTVAYPNNGLASALRTVAGSIVRGIGTRVYWVQTGGFDTHSGQGANGAGAYANLMATLGDSVLAFYTDLKNQGLLDSTMVIQFSEFSRRISENGSGGTDHGAAGIMLALGGGVRGGIYGTAPSLDTNPANPTLENAAGDVHYETDFRSVYARALEDWMGADSVPILGGSFKAAGPAIV